MKVKKFIAATMPEAMNAIRAELGHDAVILNSKIIYTGGILGFFKKKNLEVIAAVDPKQIQYEKPSVKVKKTQTANPATPVVNNQQREVKESEIQSAPKPSEELLKEIHELKSMLTKLPAKGENLYSGIPDTIRDVIALLEEQEISKSEQEKLLEVLLQYWYTNGGNESKEAILAKVKEEMTSRMDKAHFGGLSFKKKFVNVVGPTGVGKTTTLAKIAANCVLEHKKKVAFITTDTYRIAAIEQLKTYAGILDIPVEVCYSLDDFEQAANKFDHYDLILVDTAGRNFRNKKYVEDLQKVIDFKNEMETFLVLALTGKESDMEAIYNQFSLVGIDRFIFTKADETSIYGSMFNMVSKHGIGVAYITNGQDVPDDLALATPEVVMNYLLGDE